MTNPKQQKDLQIYIHRHPVGLQLGLLSPCVVLLVFVTTNRHILFYKDVCYFIMFNNTTWKLANVLSTNSGMTK